VVKNFGQLERLLVFTEHKDTLNFLVGKLTNLGFHRYGQQHEAMIFNLVARNTREGEVMDRLLEIEQERHRSEKPPEVMGRSGHGRNANLWFVAQAVSEILPDGDKEKPLMQGLLNQRDQLEKAGEYRKLF
jgi:hypothetical protein